MPLINQRTINVARHGRRLTSGKYMVQYRDVDGNTHNAVVVDAGSSSGLKLDLPDYQPTRVVDNVAAATTLKQTNVYFSRT